MHRDPIITWHRIARSKATGRILGKRIAQIGPALFCGSARADDGREVCFHKVSLMVGNWSDLKEGAGLRLREQDRQ